MLTPSACCAAFAEKSGKKPAMDVRCPPCADYHGYIQHVHSLMVERPVSAEPLLSYKAQKAMRAAEKVSTGA